MNEGEFAARLGLPVADPVRGGPAFDGRLRRLQVPDLKPADTARIEQTAAQLTHPSHGVPRVYEAVVLGSAVSRAAEFDAKRRQVETLARFEATIS